MAQSGIVCLELCFHELVAIQIHERDPAMQELIREAGLVNEEFCVAMMTRPFSHLHRRCVRAEESLSRSANQLRVGVHWSSGNVFDDIGLEKNRFAADVQIE